MKIPTKQTTNVAMNSAGDISSTLSTTATSSEILPDDSSFLAALQSACCQGSSSLHEEPEVSLLGKTHRDDDDDDLVRLPVAKKKAGLYVIPEDCSVCDSEVNVVSEEKNYAHKFSGYLATPAQRKLGFEMRRKQKRMLLNKNTEQVTTRQPRSLAKPNAGPPPTSEAFTDVEIPKLNGRDPSNSARPGHEKRKRNFSLCSEEADSIIAALS